MKAKNMYIRKINVCESQKCAGAANIENFKVTEKGCPIFLKT
jgi:hypothetical protein